MRGLTPPRRSDPLGSRGGDQGSRWTAVHRGNWGPWTAVFSENFGGPRFGGPRFSEEPGLVDPGLVDPGFGGPRFGGPWFARVDPGFCQRFGSSKSTKI